MGKRVTSDSYRALERNKVYNKGYNRGFSNALKGVAFSVAVLAFLSVVYFIGPIAP